MTKEQIRSLIDQGREIEFYKGNKLFASLTYFEENKQIYLSFCYAYQDTVDYPEGDFDKLWDTVYHGKKIGDVIESIPDVDVDIF